MPPIRRYLRITPHTVLECRIYLDNPSDTHRWLLAPRNPRLPVVIEAVRPLVLPKLREENALQAKKGGKSGKRKGWKDVVVEDDFEVAVFLTETSTRHSILRKEKRAKTESGRLGTTSGRLTGTKDTPVEVGENTPGLRREESDDEVSHVRLANVPVAGGDSAKEKAQLTDEGSQDRLFVSDEDEDEDSRAGNGDGGGNSGPRIARDRGEQDDKKKLALNTTYDGFSIYGRILCLVVKRRDTSKSKSKGSIGSAGPAMMEDWIASTQMGEGQLMDE